MGKQNRYFALCAVFLVLVGFSACKKKDKGGEQLTIETITSGEQSGLESEQQVVVESQAEWQQLWQQMHRNSTPQPDLPQVNFKEHTVIGIFMGQRSSGGHVIEATRATDLGERIEINVTRVSPGKGCMTTQAITYPFHVFKIERRKGRTYKYNVNKETLKCE